MAASAGIEKELGVSDRPIFSALPLTPRNSQEVVFTGQKENGVSVSSDTVPNDDAGDYVTGWKLAALVAGMSAACFLMLLDTSILVTAVPRITTKFHSLNDIGWYGSSYNLACAAFQPISGKFYTYFKIKWVFLTFLFVFEIGSLICGISTSSIMFIIGRAVSGLGSSGIMNGSFAIIAAAAPLERRPGLMGTVMGICQLGMVSGPLVGGALTQYTSWRWCFYINLPIGAVTALLILLINIPERLAKPKTGLFKIILTKFDLPGFCIFAPFAIMILLALEWGGNQYPWKSATVIGMFCGGGGALILFLLWELRVGADAMIPLDLIKKKEIWSSCLTGLFLISSVLGSSYFLPIYFQSVKGATPFQSGVDMLPTILTQLFFAVAAGSKSRLLSPLCHRQRMPNRHLLRPPLHALPSSSTAQWAGYQILLGFSRGISIQIPIIAIQAHTSAERTSVITATLVFCQNFGGAVFLSVANSIFNNKLKSELLSRLPSDRVEAIIDAGATGVKLVTLPQELPAVVASYAKGFDAVMYLLVGLACAMFITSWELGFTDIRKKKAAAPAVAEA
ncbi:MFS-type transporter calB [Cladobotryum mycophilum]|uniref:MFS-type transporter calB n=1 Tax=Cladobotryum mycophilum TaxID=491253 RepID=A0ABR0SB03_9HYPO